MMRKRLRGKILSILLAAALLLTVALPPVTVWAADGDLAVTGTAGGYTYDSGSGVLLFTQNGSYTVSMAPNVSVTTASSIAVASGVTADITLNGVKIDRSSAGGSAFELEETAKVTLTLASGTVNSLTGGKGSVGIGSAGLRVPEGAELTIGGTGELTATGGDSGAGIGGDWKGFSSDCGTITITSGIITAKGGNQSAGIGGGNDGNGGTIAIRGGTVTATGGDWGAGIGGGDGQSGSRGMGNGGTITISGGIITANGTDWGAGIGGGYGGSGGMITITSGTITAKGGNQSAGIGGGNEGNGGTIAIRGGTVTATGGNNGAGIGGGSNGDDAGTVSISGGTVTANGGYGGAGIGGGLNGDGGDVYISGGNVKAVAGDSEAQAIGQGVDLNGDCTSGTLKHSDAMDSPDVYLTTVALRNISAATAVSSLTTSADYAYGTKDMMTDSDGKLFLYLPSGTKTTAAQTSAAVYTGEVITRNDHQASGTLSSDPASSDDDSSDDNSSGGNSSGGGGGTPAGYLPDSAIRTTDNRVTVELGGSVTRIAADQMENLIRANRESPVVIWGKGYTLTFPQGTMQAIPGQREYDFGLQINAGSPDQNLSALAGDGLVLTVVFSHSGPLPAEARMAFQVGTAYAGQTLYYYYYNPKTGQLEYVQSAIVQKDGTITVRQSHCSDYVLTQRILNGKDISGEAERISGEDRYATAVRISKEFFSGGTDTVILARGDSPADALPAVPLAKQYNAPLLLTPTGSLPAAVLSEIRTLGAQNIILIGGTGAIGSGVEKALQAEGLKVERLSGGSRYETAYAIASKLADGSGQAVLVNGDQAEAAFADALSVAAWAGSQGIPILYADSASQGLPAGTAQAFTERNITRTILIGGTAMLPAALEELVPNPVRYSGRDRYATNAAVLKALQPDAERVYAATGRNYADALAAAAAAAQIKGSLILVDGATGSLIPEQESLLRAMKGQAKELRLIGGPAAVPASTAEALRDLLGLQQ